MSQKDQPHYRGPHQMPRLLNQVAKQAVGHGWQDYGTLLQHWREIMGDEIAPHTTPIKISLPARRSSDATPGTLHIAAPAALAAQMQMETPKLLARLNSFFGYQAFGRLVFAPSTKKLNAKKLRSNKGLAPSFEPISEDVINQTRDILDKDVSEALAALAKTLNAR